MDPNFITDQQWIEYRHLVSLLWLFPLLVFALATAMLLRFAVLPSLWNSRDEEVARHDPLWSRLHTLVVGKQGTWIVSQWLLLLVALGAAAALVAVFFVARSWTIGVIEETFNRWWI
ncbi:MAG: hypothetical protein OXT51_06845 [Chloroflexota bacterium]|nr:hypothetical protein [Chloroflexota bacterium]